jgi:PBSX family phage terminase large subunit
MTEPQRRFWTSQAKFRLFVGGVGSGKTRAGTIEAFRQQPGTNGMIIAPTYTMLEDTTLRTFMELAEEAQILKDYEKKLRKATLRGDRTVIFRSGEEPDKLRGPNIGWFMLDEAAMLSYECWRIIIGRIRERPSKGWAVTTPRGKANWVYKVFISGGKYEIIKSSTRENHFLPEDFVETLMESYTSEWQAQEIDGDFIDPSGAMFKRSWFNTTSITPSINWVRYWDLAASVKSNADYTASVAVGMDENGNVYLRDGIHLKAEWPDVQKVMIRTMLNEPFTSHYIEKALHGIAALQELMRVPEIAGVPIYSIDVKNDKVQRAMSWASRAESGKIFIVNGGWVDGFLDEVCMFPTGKHDDYVDSVSGAMPMIGNGGRLLLWE